MKNRALIFAVLALTGILSALIILLSKRSDDNQRSINQTKSLFFSGVIENTKEVFSDECLIKLKLFENSVIEYDPRDSLDAYLVVIKDSVAEFVGRCHSAMIGDTLIYNGEINQVVIRNMSIIDSYFPYVNDHLWKYDKIRELHDL